MSSDITVRLQEAAKGNRAVADEVFNLMHAELRKLAVSAMKLERKNHTLQPTALVNEAYMRLVGNPVSWESRAHFLNTAARVMRRILIDHSRKAGAGKRIAPGDRAEFNEETAGIEVGDPVLLIAIDEALNRLEAMDERQAQVVELRYFGGLSVEETAKVMSISEKTVKREWSMARAWLEGQLRPV